MCQQKNKYIAQQYMMPHTNAGIRNDNYEIQIYVCICYIPALWAGDVIFTLKLRLGYSYIAGYNYHVMDTHKLESYLVSVGYDRE